MPINLREYFVRGNFSEIAINEKTGFGMMRKCSYYFSSTLSATQCVNFCIEHSSANSTSFASYSDPRYTHTYSYFVSSDGDNKQEIFVFRQEYFGPFHLNRYKLLSCSSDEGTNATSEQVGSLLFTTINDEGQKGKTNDDGPIKYTYILTNDDGSASFTGSCSVQDGCWMIRFFDIPSLFFVCW